MSELLSPTEYGLPEVRIVKYKKPKICRICDDKFLFYRWGGSNFCPDCDIKRMKKLSDSMEKLEQHFNSLNDPHPTDDSGKKGE